MQITLTQQEIEKALRNYVTGRISLNPNTSISIDFKQTRGAVGSVSAIIDLVECDDASEVVAVQPIPVARTVEAKPAIPAAVDQPEQEVGIAENAQPEEATETEVEAAPATPIRSKSLFKDLGRPDNRS